MIEGRRSSINIPSMLGGWRQVKGEPVGTITTKEQPKDFTTPDFSNFAETSRARWNLFQYLKVKIQQRLRKK